ncbi:MAG: argininosuccinate synthase [Spirochaetes bacterium]|nr:argininosuccinate synthase [Spirochaetota bacterium]
MKKDIKKIVLAYSGGLDTSIILKWLKQKYNAEIIAYVADVGQDDDFTKVKEKALATGASKVYIEDLKDEFVREYIYPVIKANAQYESRYLLGTAIARPIIAKRQAEIAKKEKADAVSHGATGKGNDQVRFELTFKALAPELLIIAPWREWEFKGREDLINFAKKHDIPIPVTKEKPYSSDMNLFHISFESGVLEDPWNEPKDDMFVMTTSPENAPDKSEYIEIDFEKGEPVKINGKKMAPVELMSELNKIGGKHGIGRVDMVENRLVGIKNRGVYETPGGTILMNAHRDLEALTVDRDTMHYKDMIAVRYAELVYYGKWFTPLKDAFDAFIKETQEYVTGTVRVKLYKGNAMPVGRKSPHSLYDPKLATFEEEHIYNQKDAEGFINLFGLQMKYGHKKKK